MYRRKYTSAADRVEHKAAPVDKPAPKIQGDVKPAKKTASANNPQKVLAGGLSPYMTVEELQNHLNVCRRTAYTIVHTEGFPAYTVGRSIRIDRNGLEEWLHKHSIDRVI